MIHQNKRKTHGVAVIVVMMMMVLIIGFTGGAALLTKQNYTNIQHNEQVVHARYAVRAATATAMRELTKDPTWAPTEAAPYREMLNESLQIGFEIWLEQANTTSDAPLTTTSGQPLHKGQVALSIVPIVNGQKMTNAFAGGEETAIFVRPPVVFEHAIFSTHYDQPMKLPDIGGTIMSYDSNVGPPPAAAAPLVSPINTSATVRSLQDIQGGSTVVFGEAIVPQGNSVWGGDIKGGTLHTDDLPPLATFAAPLGTADIAVTPIPDPTTGYLPPGTYKGFVLSIGKTLRLQYGERYVFWGDLILDEQTEVILEGDPTNGPCVIWGHAFISGENVRINMPADPSEAPKPEMLQFYGGPWDGVSPYCQDGCDFPYFGMGENSEFAMVCALSHSGWANMSSNSTLYGSLIAKDISLYDNAKIYYDLSLRGKVQEGVSEWCVVSQSNS